MGQLVSQTRGSTTYYLPDVQVSIRALTNGTGSITDTYAYSAFGELLNTTGTTDNNYLYTGQQYDELTELYSLRARYYAPELGRFLSRDTWAYDFQNPVELNRYVYAAGNPVRWSDPSGYVMIERVAIDTNIGVPSRVAPDSLFRYYLARKFQDGFIGGVLGWTVGKIILAALKPSQYSPIGDYEWWIHASNGLDVFLSGVMGGFIEIGNASFPRVMNYAIRVSKNVGDAARLMLGYRAAIGYYFVVRWKFWNTQ